MKRESARRILPPGANLLMTQLLKFFKDLFWGPIGLTSAPLYFSGICRPKFSKKVKNLLGQLNIARIGRMRSESHLARRLSRLPAKLQGVFAPTAFCRQACDTDALQIWLSVLPAISRVKTNGRGQRGAGVPTFSRRTRRCLGRDKLSNRRARFEGIGASYHSEKSW